MTLEQATALQGHLIEALARLDRVRLTPPLKLVQEATAKALRLAEQELDALRNA